jgi:nickel-dependent lactate racemase
MPELRYGADSSVRLEFAAGISADVCGTPRGRPLDNPAAAVADVLEEPLDYPPFRLTATPGDRVVVTLGRGVPQSAQITAAVIRSLLAAGVEPDGITILRTQADVTGGVEDPRRLLGEPLKERISTVVHDPHDRGGLAYLAATESGEPIMLNRLLTDADVVLPIGCMQSEAATGYFGIHTPLFPTFSDQKAQARFRRLDALGTNGPCKRELKSEVEHAAWLLGVNFTIQLVPAAGEGILHVVAGETAAVKRRSRQLYDDAWSWSLARRASLVVAAIEGGAVQQTWENFGRTLEAACALVEDDGAIAVCCDLAAAPGPGVQHLAGARSRRAVLEQIRKHRPADTLPAAQLAQALDRDKVYLLSRLDPALVEELDMVPMANGDELVRLTRQHNSCILLNNAPYAQVTIEEGMKAGDEG